LLGDVLIGAPFKGHVLPQDPGHKANVELARRMRQLYKKKKSRQICGKEKGHVFPIINAIFENKCRTDIRFF